MLKTLHDFKYLKMNYPQINNLLFKKLYIFVI